MGSHVYNIVPVDNPLANHAAVLFPEVRASIAALKCVGDLRRPPHTQWTRNMDLLDWLRCWFGFQEANAKNQREHLVLLLANVQMRSQPAAGDKLEASVVRKIRKKVTKNYVSWCQFVGKKHNLRVLDSKESELDERRELLYTSLYLLIWGEAANIRFMPECVCFIFHHMVLELNRMLEGFIDEGSARESAPTYREPNGFLKNVIIPLFEVVQAEAGANKNGTASHSSWRNYDDLNEYFWDNRCFTRLSWPLDKGCNYLVKPSAEGGTKHKVGKTGFVEQRSFFNIFRSFDRLWIGYILILQACIVTLWSGSGAPWFELQKKDSLARLLTIFITWSALRLFQALLDTGMQYNLLSWETWTIGVRMILKAVVASIWVVIFSVLYRGMWYQRHQDHAWSTAANTLFMRFIYASAAFVLPEALALVLFIIPFVRNFLENTNFKFFHLLTWWFQTRAYVGRGLREGLVDNFKYTLFWALVLASKFLFSYFFQIKPLIKPTKEILQITDIQYKWHQFFSHGNRVAVLALWAPVILIYFMDTQIWYCVWSSLFGALVGLLDHLGEIRNVNQLKTRFQMFPSAVQFNLTPETWGLKEQYGWWVNTKNLFKRIKLRYGAAAQEPKDENMEAKRFSYTWNEILQTFREEDLISNRELELLEIPSADWGISVFQWPSTLLANEVCMALSLVEYQHGADKVVWKKITKIEYRRCAVIESYDSIKHVLLHRIVRTNSEEQRILIALFEEIDAAIEHHRFTKTFLLSKLSGVHKFVLQLVTEILAVQESQEKAKAKAKAKTEESQEKAKLLQESQEKAKVLQESQEKAKVVKSLQDLYEFFCNEFLNGDWKQTFKGTIDEIRSNKFRLVFSDAVKLPVSEDKVFYRQLKRLQTTLETKESMLLVPKGLEARRRISFFSNSLFMTMPRAPQVEKMLAFSVLTPYYAEDVIYSERDLDLENEDGINILFYLQKVFPDDWNNFKERFSEPGCQNLGKPEDDTHFVNRMKAKEDLTFQLCLWASYRGQTLTRTVRGMMYYERALECQAFLDAASETDLNTALGFRKMVAQASSSNEEELNDLSNSEATLRSEQVLATAAMKFTYVVAAQLYGKQKKENAKQAQGIAYLLKTYKGLRVAYVDEVKSTEGMQYFSVLVKYDQDLQDEVEIFRVQLPGPLKQGEGKPENQNHALIFTRGDAVQTIDMNQEMYFEEALKMRNLLQEFGKRHGVRKPTILGVREHVFTGSVSSLAWFMSAQETSFVTLGQRVLANPLKIRMHYGHPDVFDRLWFLTRGGISKASRTINISEDIFAGFNCTLRGGTVTHHEYIQAGKGRDVGLNQIALFEAKVSSGNGEQVLSRDVYRLGHRLDFFRMLSFYYTTVGFFINNLIVVLTVFAFLWGRVYLALSGAESSFLTSKILDNTALTAALNQQFIVQLGILTALPMIVENALEHGFRTALWDFFTMQLQLASVFFTFSMGTRAHYFGRTLLHGGAMYRATGRGFVVKHERFAANYRLYSRSHFVKGIELIILLIVYQTYGATRSSATYILIVLTSWFLALCWIMAPFVFNPSGFDWLKTLDDYEDFTNWLWYKGGIITGPDQSWESWWHEEQKHFQQTGLWGKALEVLLDLRFFFFQYGIVYQLRIFQNNHSFWVYLSSWSYVVVAGLIHFIISFANSRLSIRHHSRYRAVQAILIVIVSVVIALLKIFTTFTFMDLLTSLLAFLPTGWGLIQIILVFRTQWLEKKFIWPIVVSVARLYELGMGLIVLAPVVILSWLPGFQAMQTRVLFNEGFSRGLHISTLLATVGKKSKEKETKEK